MEPLRRSDDYPREKWAIVGYVVAHPRTWCLLLGIVVGWQCMGLKEWTRRHVKDIVHIESDANASAASTEDHH